MKCHPEKCQVIRTNTTNVVTVKCYRLHGHPLEVVDNGKYLGVYLSSDLHWHTYIYARAVEAPKTLGFLMCNLSECTKHMKSAAYTSLVRPSLKYPQRTNEHSKTGVSSTTGSTLHSQSLPLYNTRVHHYDVQ